jgi:hypothetical protein
MGCGAQDFYGGRRLAESYRIASSIAGIGTNAKATELSATP